MFGPVPILKQTRRGNSLVAVFYLDSEVINQVNFDPVEFWVAMNATYSDICAASSKHGVDNIDFYTDIATAFWLKDEDAVENNESAYYEHVVNH